MLHRLSRSVVYFDFFFNPMQSYFLLFRRIFFISVAHLLVSLWMQFIGDKTKCRQVLLVKKKKRSLLLNFLQNHFLMIIFFFLVTFFLAFRNDKQKFLFSNDKKIT